MLELTGRDIKAIITVFHMFKKVGGDLEGIKETQIKLLVVKTNV